jgi:hypothetical protein
VLVALVYLLLRRIVRLVAGSPSDLNREVEMVVLRHQLMVLRRQAGRPRLRRRDRVFMAAMSRVFLEPGGRRSWTARRHSFAGTGSWFGGNGASGGPPWAAGRSQGSGDYQLAVAVATERGRDYATPQVESLGGAPGGVAPGDRGRVERGYSGCPRRGR